MISEVFTYILFGGLIFCALFATLCKRMFTTVLIYMSYSLIMAMVWLVIEAPDLAGTEAAVGAGVTTLLFIISLRKLSAIETESRNKGEFGIDSYLFDEGMEHKEDE